MFCPIARRNEFWPVKDSAPSQKTIKHSYFTYKTKNTTSRCNFGLSCNLQSAPRSWKLVRTGKAQLTLWSSKVLKLSSETPQPFSVYQVWECASFVPYKRLGAESADLPNSYSNFEINRMDRTAKHHTFSTCPHWPLCDLTRFFNSTASLERSLRDNTNWSYLSWTHIKVTNASTHMNCV